LTYTEIENILQTYTLDDILELNDCTLEDVLYYLVDQQYLILPEPEPV
jgi:hypothetical protein